MFSHLSNQSYIRYLPLKSFDLNRNNVKFSKPNNTFALRAHNPIPLALLEHV